MSSWEIFFHWNRAVAAATMSTAASAIAGAVFLVMAMNIRSFRWGATA